MFFFQSLWVKNRKCLRGICLTVSLSEGCKLVGSKLVSVLSAFCWFLSLNKIVNFKGCSLRCQVVYLIVLYRTFYWRAFILTPIGLCLTSQYTLKSYHLNYWWAEMMHVDCSSAQWHLMTVNGHQEVYWTFLTMCYLCLSPSPLLCTVPSSRKGFWYKQSIRNPGLGSP